MGQDKPGQDQATAPDKADGWSWWTANSTVIIGILSVAVVAMRLLGVARGDPETAYAILQVGGTGNVLVATLVSTLGLLAMPAAVILGYVWLTKRNDSTSKPAEVHVLLAIWLVTLYIALYMSPIVLGFYSVLFLLIVLRIHKRSTKDQKESDSTKKRTNWPIVFLVAALVIGNIAFELSSPTPWLPEQVIYVAIQGQEQEHFSGYVLTQANGETSILTSSPEGVFTVPSQDVLYSEQCTPHLYVWEQETLFDLWERFRHKLTTYQACPSTPYGQIGTAGHL